MYLVELQTRFLEHLPLIHATPALWTPILLAQVSEQTVMAKECFTLLTMSHLFHTLPRVKGIVFTQVTQMFLLC